MAKIFARRVSLSLRTRLVDCASCATALKGSGALSGPLRSCMLLSLLPTAGCIGSLAPRSLAELPKYALKSAFHDSRFEPLRPDELPDLEVGVSLLVNYEEADHVLGEPSFDAHRPPAGLR